MEQLPEQHQLRPDCKIFIAQEANHYRNHARFNEVLRASGYPELERREQGIKADYDYYWAKKGLTYCMRYAEGFETLAPILACFFLEGARELRGNDVDDPTADLWRWHLCEEYEHRHVCFHLHHTLYPSYWLRLWGLMYAGRHMLNYMIGTARYLIREDRRSGRISDSVRSRIRFSSVMIRMFAYAIPRLLQSASPSYDPRNISPPPGCQEILEKAERLWGHSSSPVANSGGT